MTLLWILLGIGTHIGIFFLIRNTFQIYHKRGYLHPQECQMDWTWYLPVGNIVTLIMSYVGLLWYMAFVDPNNRKPKKTFKITHPRWIWLTNQHLKG